MDLASIGGFVLGLGLILWGILFGGNALGLYWDAPSLIIVVGGSFAGMLAMSPMSRITSLGKVFGVFMNMQVFNKQEIINQLVAFSESARKEGLLSLDDALNDVEDDFLRGGMRLVVDGSDPDVIKSVLYSDLDKIEGRHQKGIDFFGNWGTLGPAFGMIGTLIGLIGMMANLEDISSVGKNMGVALITTFYGSILANLFLIPIQKKLLDKHENEMLVKEIMVEGILSIQAGDNPRILEQKLYTFLSPDERPASGGGEE
ncbi:MAG: motility protein A [Spirochaetales bacterium]|nr:motility protein A [Spirochaetales bacterium]